MSPRTFDHLQGRRRRPNVYDEVTSHVQWGETFRGKFPALPSEGAYYHFPEQYKLGYWDPSKTRWASAEWEAFRDPNQLTYRTYHEVQHARENTLTEVLSGARKSDAVARLDSEWVEVLRTLFGPLRFAEWGVSMACQYVSRFAITAAITNCAVLQSFDELRHTQRIAEWTRDLETAHGGFGNYRAQWLEVEMFQPLREYLERTCVLRDWGEVVVAVNVVLEPMLQPVLHSAMADLGQSHGDVVLPHFSYSLQLDEQRHWAWGRKLAETLHADERNVEHTQQWIDLWYPRAERAVAAFGAVFDAVSRRDLFEQAFGDAKTEIRASFGELTVLAPAGEIPAAEAGATS